MKNSLFAAGLFLAVAAMVSCQKEQSELRLESIPSDAVLTGTVEYEVGDYEVNGAVISNHRLPAASQTVMVTIPTSDYAGGAQGNQYFETVTDENGNYRIEIPVGNSPVSATVTVLPFNAQKSFAQADMSIVSISDALYNNVVSGSSESLTVSMSQKMVYTRDMIVRSDDTLPVTFDQTIEVNGKAEVETWLRATGVDETSDEYYIAGTNPLERRTVKIEASVSDPSDRSASPVRITVTAVTDNDGNHSASMTLPSNCWDMDTEFTASTDASLETNFIHRYCYTVSFSYPVEYSWRTQDVDVIYQYAEGTATLSDSNKLIPVEVSAITVETEPVSRENLYGVTVFETSDGNTIPRSSNNKLGW